MGLKKFCRNIAYLTKNQLSKKENNFEDLKFQLFASLYEIPIPEIKSIDETLDLLINQNYSLCRFGDGEFLLMEGVDIPFQKFSQKLSEQLNKVLSCSQKNILIGIPETLYAPKRYLNEQTRRFWNTHRAHIIKQISPFIQINGFYVPAEVSLAYTHYDDYDFESYFDKIRKIWENKEIVLVSGKGIFDKLKHDIFDNCQKIDYVIAPAQNAFEEYDNILEKILPYPNGKLIVCILGPTATVLCHDLALRGYQALDMGHIAKSYDLYKRKDKLWSNDDYVQFYKQD